MTTINVNTLNGSNGFVIDGIFAGSQLGFSVDGAGDVNNDGFADIVLGLPRRNRTAGFGTEGESYVVFGDSSFDSSIILSTLDSSQGFFVNGFVDELFLSNRTLSAQAGFSVSGAGDVNNDGFGDFIIGAPFARRNSDDGNGGYSYLVFGRTNFGNELELESPETNQVVIIGPGGEDAFAGTTVSEASDINNDGFDDLIITAPGESSQIDDGVSYLIFGSANLGSSISLSSGFRLTNFSDFDASSAGDIDNDGFDDLVLSNNTNQVAIVYGKETGFGSSIDLNNLGNNGFTISGLAIDNRLGFSVSNAGDVNGDGIADIVISAPGSNSNAGESYVLFGTSRKRSGNLDVSSISGNNGFKITAPSSNALLGTDVSSAGDVNNDGFDDLIVTAPGEAKSYVIYGRSGFSSSLLQLDRFNDSNGFIIEGLSDSIAVGAAGDVNNDGFDDVVIGNASADVGSSVDAGQSYVVFGSAIPLNLFGTRFDDLIHGTDEDNLIDGLAGNDTLLGKEGNDTLRGRNGNDSLNGGDSNDLLVGGAGNDTLSDFLSNGNDTLNGGDGNDSLNGGAGNDTLTGGNGNDSLSDSFGSNNLIGGNGQDTLVGRAFLNGGNDNDLLIGSTTDDTLIGGSGNDSLNDGGNDDGNDLLIGGAGNDTLEAGDENDTLRGNNGRDLLIGGDNEDLLLGGAGNDTLDGEDGSDILNGGTGNDLLRGNDSSDNLFGQGGRDTLIGSSGNDRLDGGNGVDTVDYSVLGQAVTLKALGEIDKGSFGQDRLIGTGANGLNPSVEVIIGATGLTNTIDGSPVPNFSNAASFDIDLSAESLTINGLSNPLIFDVVNFVDVVGTNNDDTIIGDTGSNTIFGSGGNDLLSGGEDGEDTVNYSQLSQAVTLQALGTIDKGILGIDTLQGLGTQGLISSIDRIIGAVGEENTIDGSPIPNGSNAASFDIDLSAESLIINGLGNPLEFDVVNFVDVRGTTNNDSIVGSDSNETLNGGNGEDTLLGNDGDDRLRGRDGNDSLDGGTGNDILFGDLGSDTITGAEGSDRFTYLDVTESNASSRDTIDFDAVDDTIDLSFIDANVNLGGNQTFEFIGSASFSGAGQVRFDAVNDLIQANVDGNLATVELEIFSSVDITSLTEDDLIL